MKKWITITFVTLSFLNPSYGSNQRSLPNQFFLKCKGSVVNLGIERWVEIDRIKGIGEIKVPDFKKLKICEETSEMIMLKKDCNLDGYFDEYVFNKWNGSFKKSEPCEIFDSNQKPLYE